MPKRNALKPSGCQPDRPAEERPAWNEITREVAQLSPEFVVWDLEPVLGGSILAYMIGELGMEPEHLPERIKNNPDLIMRLRLALKLVKLLERTMSRQEVAGWFKGGELLLPGCPAEQIRSGFSNTVEARLRSQALRQSEETAA